MEEYFEFLKIDVEKEKIYVTKKFYVIGSEEAKKALAIQKSIEEQANNLGFEIRVLENILDTENEQTISRR